MFAMAAIAGAIVRASEIADDGTGGTTVLTLSVWTFGVATVALGTIKLGIALILWGIVRRLWIRIESTKVGLAKLVPNVEGKGEVASASAVNPHVKVTVSAKARPPYTLHRTS